MKRFLDKTWTKVAAFILFFVFLGLSIAGGVGIYFLAANDVYLAGSEASRQILYDGQASDVMTTVIDGLYNCSDKEALRDWLLERCPPENGYGITVTNAETGEEIVTALPKDAKIIYTAHRRTVFSGTELNVTIELQEGFIPRTYEYRLSLWLLDMKNALIPLTVLFVVLVLFCFFWQMAAAGHWQGFEGIHLTWFDKIPLDLMAVGILIPALAIFGEYYLYSSRLLKALWGTAILCFVYLFIISFVTRCKAGTVLKNNVVWYAIRLLWRIVKKPLGLAPSSGALHSGDLADGTGDCCHMPVYPYHRQLQFDVVAAHGSAVSAADDVRALCCHWICYPAARLQGIGGGRLQQAGGYALLRGDLKRCGENLNKVQQGVQRAVDERLRSERMKTELITNVSHDIKTPLTSIVNYVDLLKKEDIDNPKAQEYLEVLDRQSKRLKKAD